MKRTTYNAISLEMQAIRESLDSASERLTQVNELLTAKRRELLELEEAVKLENVALRVDMDRGASMLQILENILARESVTSEDVPEHLEEDIQPTPDDIQAKEEERND